MKLVPLSDRVVLKQCEAEETTKSGIVLPGQSKEKPQQAEVVAVGPGGYDILPDYLITARISFCFTMMYSSPSNFTSVPAYFE